MSEYVEPELFAKSQIIGIVVGELKPNVTGTGKHVVNFRVAAGESGHHNIVAWEGLADKVNEKITTGSKVFIEGRQKRRKYEKDGQDIWTTDVVAAHIELIEAPEPAPAF